MNILVKCSFSFIIMAFFFGNAFSQGPPATDIFLIDYVSKVGEFKVGEPVNMTHREGYDNQPMFFPVKGPAPDGPEGSRIFYTSIRADGQADTYSYHLSDGTTSRVTHAQESEYSPTPMPDGKHFSVVRVEADSVQRLWKFPIEGGQPGLILENLKPVGYHAWGNETTVALFILGDPNSLHIANIQTGESKKIMGSIGRSLHKIPGQNAFSFVHKISEKEGWIKRIDIESHEIKPLIETLEGSEDYAWTPDGQILMGKGATLFKCDLSDPIQWVEIADFSDQGLQNITRIAVSPKGNKLALVSGR